MTIRLDPDTAKLLEWVLIMDKPPHAAPRAHSLRLIILLLTLLLAAAPALADLEQQRIQAIEAARKSVASIRTYRPGQQEPGIGSGVILRSDGFILTNQHVIKGAKVIKVHLQGGKQYTAQVWKTSDANDLALLKIDARNLPVARIGNSDQVKLGQSAIAIGDPLGFAGTVTIGTVGGLGRDVEAGGVHYKSLIQTDAAINPGSSGGALINLKGEVIGINTLVYNGPRQYKHAQGLGFAIPINHVIQVSRELVKGSANPTAGKSWLGITGQDLTPEDAMDRGIPAKRGVLVLGVISGSPAEAANIRTGDAITAADGQTVLNVNEFMGVLSSRDPGETVNLSVWRDGKKATIPVTLDVQSQ
ncbi:MAG: trypsin-like peptidase domain-containing protein [Armatimonadetes bacterium]|nr:trypsin-like peptidase domain-containing protein [Armatimonadota bacterium]